MQRLPGRMQREPPAFRGLRHAEAACRVQGLSHAEVACLMQGLPHAGPAACRGLQHAGACHKHRQTAVSRTCHMQGRATDRGSQPHAGAYHMQR